MFDNLKKHESDGIEIGSAKYGLFSKEMGITMSVATVLISITLAVMPLFANTVVSELVLAVFSYPIVGVLLFGGLLSGGHYLAQKGMEEPLNYVYMSLGSLITIISYGAFGGAILSLYVEQMYLPAMVVTSIITVGISLIIGLVVFGSNKDFSHYWKYASGFFAVTLISSLIGTFYSPILIVSLISALIGFTFELVYEVWRISTGERTPLANGFGFYVAFLGVFVHILQIVIRFLADR